MRITNLAATLTLLTILSSLCVITPAQAVRASQAGAGSEEPACGAIETPTGIPAAILLAAALPQTQTRGCCVLKSGAKNQWRYIYTTSQNCTQLAREANTSYSFYPNADCNKIKSK